MSAATDKALEALGEGGRTYQVAHKLGWSTVFTRRALLRLEREGKVRRDDRHSAINDIRWIPGDAA
jgi:DNA-binding IclR family transcriptional regulator